MINLGTLAGLHRRQHQLAACCSQCDSCVVRGLAEPVAAGRGEPTWESMHGAGTRLFDWRRPAPTFPRDTVAWEWLGSLG